MDELSMAAATLAVSMDIDEIDDVGVEPASSTSVTTDVLSAILTLTKVCQFGLMPIRICLQSPEERALLT